MVLALFAAAPLLYSAVERRSDATRAASNMERESMIAAAKMIIADYPMGVGANRYVVVANVGGYSARAGVAWNPANREAPVHNSYYLVTAELGWLGLIGFVGLLSSIIAIGLSASRRIRGTFESELLVGVTASVIIVAVHSYYEWITMYYHIHYLFAISVGLLVGLRSSLLVRRQKRPEVVRSGGYRVPGSEAKLA
jgi:hypothetical protein